MNAVTLGEVCDYRPPKSEARERLRDSDSVSFLPMEDLGIDQRATKPTQTRRLGDVAGSYTYFADGDVLLAKITPCFQNGKLAIARNLVNGVGFGSSEYIVLRPRAGLLPEYLFYFLCREDFREVGVTRMGGSVGQQRVPPEYVLEQRMLLPPLPEQRRIVAILDEAFAALAAARAATEQRVQRSRESLTPAFKAVLAEVCDQPPTTTVEQVAAPQKGSIRTGPFGSQLLHSEFVDEGIAVLGIDNAVQNTFAWRERRYITAQKYAGLRRYTVHPGDVIITIMGTCGRCAVVPNEIPVAINSKHLCCITLNAQKCLPAYLHAYFLYHSNAQEYLSERAQGSIMDGLNMGIIKDLPLVLPATSLQQQIIHRFHAIKQSIQKIEELAGDKLAALSALKCSLLHHAFTGQLTQSSPVSEQLFPSLVTMSDTDLHAGVLALAYQLHEQHGKTLTFGHVKAEKIAHMAEAWAGLEFGRAPLKDAAGPNDYPHLLKVEHRAKKAGYFTVFRVGERYRLSKGSKFDELIARTTDVLGDRKARLDQLLSVMVPMGTTEAEVFATVFAAWNNLLMDGVKPSNEQIVRAAREEWHPDKMEVERKRFFDAISWMTREDLVPRGDGKRVVPKAG